MADLENKRIFLIATGDPETNRKLEELIKLHVINTTVFTAVDGLDAMLKCQNVPPHVVIMDYGLQKVSALDLTEKLIHRKERAAVIILSPLPDKEHFIDEVVTGQVQFLSGSGRVTVFTSHITRALNWISHEDKSIYHLRFLAPQELLIKEGEKADYVYLLKSGELKAYKKDSGREVLLGLIKPGEFVGEMAYINGEARSANVMSVTDSELIEIPSESLDAVLFSKPAWSKALLKTLSKRLKNSNLEKVSKTD
jgi:DNA-binding NarL/FixJ family response regulator